MIGWTSGLGSEPARENLVSNLLGRQILGKHASERARMDTELRRATVLGEQVIYSVSARRLWFCSGKGDASDVVLMAIQSRQENAFAPARQLS